MSDSCTRPSGTDHSCQCFHWWPHGTCWKWVNTLLPDQWAGSLFLMEAGSPADWNILNKFFGWSIPLDSHQWNPHNNHLVTQDCEHKRTKQLYITRYAAKQQNYWTCWLNSSIIIGGVFVNQCVDHVTEERTHCTVTYGYMVIQQSMGKQY